MPEDVKEPIVSDDAEMKKLAAAKKADMVVK